MKLDLSKIMQDKNIELTEETVNEVSSHLDTIVEARVLAKLDLHTEMAEKESNDKYTSLLESATRAFDKDLTTLEESLLEKAQSYQKLVFEKMESFVTDFVESKNVEINEHKEEMVSKLGGWLEMNINESFEQELLEDVAELRMYRPIINSIQESFKTNYIPVEENGRGLLEEARIEIEKSRKALSKSENKNISLVNDSNTLKESIVDLERFVEISKVCEGLTTSHREIAVKYLSESTVETSSLKSHFLAVKDIILTERVVNTVDKEVISESADNVVRKVVTESENKTEEETNVVTESVSTKATEILGYADDFAKMWK